jgi:hypothetical protein
MKQDESSKQRVLADEEIPVPGHVKIKLGPFQHDEVPRIRIRRENVFPAGSLVSQEVRLDEGDSYFLVYNFDNYGTKTVKVTIRRVD